MLPVLTQLGLLPLLHLADSYLPDFSLAVGSSAVFPDPSGCDRYLTKASCRDQETTFLPGFFSLIFLVFLNIQFISYK